MIYRLNTEVISRIKLLYFITETHFILRYNTPNSP